MERVNRDRNENVFARPKGLRENAESAISGRGVDLPEKRGKPIAGRRMSTGVPSWQSQSRTRIGGRFEMDREKWDVLEMRENRRM